MITRKLNCEYWGILNSLKIVTIVATAPRPGTDFLHSLFDGHSQILTFDGFLSYHEFYDQAVSLHGTKKNFLNDLVNNDLFENINVNNYFSEFAWRHLHKFDSRYDNLENKGNLGKNGNEFNLINIDSFVKFASELISGRTFSSRNTLLATYAAYALSRGEDISHKKILLHNVHLQYNVDVLLQDFPDTKIIACTRDPRATPTKIKTSNEKIALSKYSINMASALFTLGIDDADMLLNYKNDNLRINVLERLHSHPKEVMPALCEWLGIDYIEGVLLQSTWGGKLWNGDILSTDLNGVFDTSRYLNEQKKWSKDMMFYEQIVVESLMNERIYPKIHVNKSCSGCSILLPVLILLPTKYEISIFLDIWHKKSIKLMLFLLRAILYRYYRSYKKISIRLFCKQQSIKII